MNTKNYQFNTILASGESYHVLSRCIAGYQIFKYKRNLNRFTDIIWYYQYVRLSLRFSKYLISPRKPKIGGKKLVDILCYCLMPNHFHLVLTQLEERGISVYLNRLLNSYSRYFNVKHDRKGPLWEGRFKRKRLNSDEQLLHLTRYVHLNPVTDFMVEDPVDYPYSSYREYLRLVKSKISNPTKVLGESYSAKRYKKFVMDQKDYQRRLKEIKNCLIDY